MTGIRNVTPTRWLVEGETIGVGELTFSVLHVPGHTPGHLAFFNAPSRFALVGDTLFQGSVGRTDFPYGNHDELIAGIKGKLLTGPLAERNFGVVELTHDPDRYRITLKLFDEFGDERVSYPLPG